MFESYQGHCTFSIQADITLILIHFYYLEKAVLLHMHRAVVRFLLIGGKLRAMLNSSIILYCKILTPINFYCKFFNFKNFQIFKINIIIILKGFGMIEKLLFFIIFSDFNKYFAKIKKNIFCSPFK